MTFIFGCIIFLFLSGMVSAETCTSDETANINKTFTESKIVSQILNEAPECLLPVEFPSGQKAHLGNRLTISGTASAPNVIFESDPQDYNTVVLIDADVPTTLDRFLSEGRQWLVVNIPGSNVTKGEAIVSYLGPTPLIATGSHRYVCLLYRQPGYIHFDESPALNYFSSNVNRYNFSIRDFAKIYKLGEPARGNYFEVQFGNDIGLQI